MLVKLTHPLDLPKPIAVAINRASRKTIFISENSSDPRPTVADYLPKKIGNNKTNAEKRRKQQTKN